jgi:hypothetical protein
VFNRKLDEFFFIQIFPELGMRTLQKQREVYLLDMPVRKCDLQSALAKIPNVLNTDFFSRL